MEISKDGRAPTTPKSHDKNISILQNEGGKVTNALSESSQDVLDVRDTKKNKNDSERGSGGKSRKSGNVRNIYFLHGNKMFKQVFGRGSGVSKVRQILRQTNRQTGNEDILVMGHLHPAISLSDGYKKERYKCFLKGKWNGFVVYILPSFSSVGFGYDVRNLGGSVFGRKSKKHDFFVIPDKDLKKFEVVVYDSGGGGGLGFGKLGKLIR